MYMCVCIGHNRTCVALVSHHICHNYLMRCNCFCCHTLRHPLCCKLHIYVYKCSSQLLRTTCSPHTPSRPSKPSMQFNFHIVVPTLYPVCKIGTAVVFVVLGFLRPTDESDRLWWIFYDYYSFLSHHSLRTRFGTIYFAFQFLMFSYFSLIFL